MIIGLFFLVSNSRALALHNTRTPKTQSSFAPKKAARSSARPVGRSASKVRIPPLRAKWRNPSLYFGITVHPSGQYGQVRDWQIESLKRLGVKFVKIDYVNRLGPEENDSFINALYEAGFEPVLIIDWKNQDHVPFAAIESEQFAYAIASEIAGRYKGKVKYFQISGEMENEILKGSSYNGIGRSDYNLSEFYRFLPWIRGTLNGLKDANPEAQRIMSFQYTHVGFLDLLRDRGGLNQYEIIGWNIYSDQAYEMERFRVGEGYFDVLSNLVFRGKSIWLTEVSRRLGARDGNEVAQAQYLQQIANYVKLTPEISAFFAFELADQPEITDQIQDRYGLIELKGSDWQTNSAFRRDRIGFDAYKKIIIDWKAGL